VTFWAENICPLYHDVLPSVLDSVLAYNLKMKFVKKELYVIFLTQA